MDLKNLLEKIANALFQECLVWQYDLRADEPGDGSQLGLRMVLADSDATALEIRAAVDRATSIVTFDCKSDRRDLGDMCRQLRVNLGQTEVTTMPDDDSVSSPASAIDAFLETIAREVLQLDESSSAAPTIRLSTFPLGAEGKTTDYEA